MDRALSPIHGAIVMVVVTIILATMFTVLIPDLYDLDMIEKSYNRAINDDTGALGHDAVVYTDENGHLHSLEPDGTTTAYDPAGVDDSWNAEGIGPKEFDLDDDGRREVPYVNGQNDLKLVDESGDTQVLVSDARKTLVGVGTWGNATIVREPGVYYVNNTNDDLYRVAPGEPSELVASGGDGFKAVSGVSDYNDDGDSDLVFVDNDGEIAYFDDGARHQTGFGPVGHSAGYGVGDPRDLNGDGRTRAPIVDNSPLTQLLASDGTATSLSGGSNVAKAPVSAIDWTGDSDLEIVYVGDSGTLYYVALDGTRHQITDANGNPVEADADQGVA